MNTNDWNDVAITHVVNPYGIWIADLVELDNHEASNTLLRISDFLEEEYRKKNMLDKEVLKFEIGQFVGIYYQTLKIWARGIVDDMYGDNSLLIWLIDFGFHLSKITLPELIMPLSSEAINQASDMIHKIGLYGVIPVHLIPDPLFTTFETKPCKFFMPAALKIMEEYLRKCTNVKFLRKHEVKQEDGTVQNYGRMVLVIDGKQVDLTEVLINNKVAMYNEQQFLEGISSMKNVLRIDRIVPHSAKQIQMGNAMLEYFGKVSRCDQNHLQFVVNWTRNATKAVKNSLLAPIEDDLQ